MCAKYNKIRAKLKYIILLTSDNTQLGDQADKSLLTGPHVLLLRHGHEKRLLWIIDFTGVSILIVVHVPLLSAISQFESTHGTLLPINVVYAVRLVIVSERR